MQIWIYIQVIKRDKSDLNVNSTVVIKNIKVDYSVKNGDAR